MGIWNSAGTQDSILTIVEAWRRCDARSPETRPPRKHRPRTLKGGTILGGVNDSQVTCTIRNMHDCGAELRVHLATIVPHEFLLYVSADSICCRSVVRWRNGERVGVMFVGTEPKPWWHYG